MNPAEIVQSLEALTGIAQIIDRLGIPGLVLLALSGPAIVVLAILFLEYHRSIKQRAENAELLAAMREENERARESAAGQLEAYRTDTQSVLRALGEKHEKQLEAYRTDTQRLLHDLGENQRATDQYYKDNVELVKRYESIAKGFQDVVVSNTRAVERLNTLLEDRK